MGEFVIVTTLLTFSHTFLAIVSFRRGFKKGYRKGAEDVLDEWRDWLKNSNDI